jgi:hypothetical protein
MLSSTAMLRFARSLLQPAPTSPLDPYRWRNDNRSTGEKAASGARLGFGLVAGFLVLVLAIAGISAVSPGAFAYGHHGPLVSWGMVCLSALILFFTANRWASIGPGFFCVPGLFKSLGVLVFGTNASSTIPYHGITRTQAGEILVVCIIVIGATWRFARNHPTPTTFIDRIALTFFVLATLKQMVIPSTWPPWPLLSGLFALLIAWCVYRWEHTRGRKHHHGSRS